MGCTTILVGKKASVDGSTIMARTDDSGHGSFEAKRFEVIAPEDLPKTYRSVLSHVEIPLPETGLRYTRFPDVDTHKGLHKLVDLPEPRETPTPGHLPCRGLGRDDNVGRQG